MSRTRRAIAALAIITLLASACSPPAETDNRPEPQTPGTGGAATTSTAETVTVLDYFVDEIGTEAFQQVIDDCESSTGHAIQRESVPIDQVMARLLQGAGSGTMPDVALVDHVNVRNLAAAGALRSLTSLEIDTSDFVPGIIEAATHDGELYGISPAINTLALFYNEDLLAEAGIEVPGTWEELKSAAAVLSDGDRYGFGVSMPPNEVATFQFLPFFWSNGAELDDVASPAAVEALDFVVGLLDDGSMSPSVVTWSQQDLNDQFASGNVAMMVNGPWNISTLDQSGQLSYGIAPIPVPRAGDDVRVPLGGEMAILPQTSQLKAGAEDVLQCITNNENSLAWATANTRVPPRQQVAVQQSEEHPIMESFSESVLTARARTGGETGMEYDGISLELQSAIQSSLTGAMTPEEALTQAAEALDQSA